jgi:hypothetical protein
MQLTHNIVDGFNVVDILLEGKGGCTPPGFASIDASLRIWFRKVCRYGKTVVQCRVTGAHDGFPWYELYVNSLPIYQFDPCSAGQWGQSLLPPMEWPVEQDVWFDVPETPF